jgi:GGDEF domain-containing protein
VTATTNAGAPGTAGLRESWRAASLDSIWLRPGDWYHPSVDPLALAVAVGTDPSQAALDLGQARGEAGVGIGEALDDLACLYRVAGVASPPLAAVRALAEGWSDAQAGLAVHGGAVDAETGLPTRQYLGVRLAETYQDAERTGRPASTTHQLTLVDVAAGEVSMFLRAARSAAVGAALRSTFGSGHPMATLGGGVFVVLARRDADHAAELARLQQEIDRRSAPLEVRAVTRHPVRVWTESLPSSHEEAEQRLARLGRPTA